MTYIFNINKHWTGMAVGKTWLATQLPDEDCQSTIVLPTTIIETKIEG